MHSTNINQLVISGSAPVSYASHHVLHHMLDMNIPEKSLVDSISKSFSPVLSLNSVNSNESTPFDDFSHSSSSLHNISEMILSHSSFSNNNIVILLRSALMSGAVSFRRVVRDFKLIHRGIFSREINQLDKRRNALLWYLVIAGLYSAIEELYQLAPMELDINVKNGLLSHTILHYAVTHGNTAEVQKLLDIGVDANVRDRVGRTPLHYVALYGTKYENNVEVTKLLIHHGLSPNLKDTNGQTSLHFSSIKVDAELLEYLVSLPDTNVCVRDKKGYTSICYLCEHILNLPNDSLENNQYADRLGHICQSINLILSRCPTDEISNNFHISTNVELGENLFLHVCIKLTNVRKPPCLTALFDHLQSIIIGSDRDHRLLVERLLELSSWKPAVVALGNTHGVNISKALCQFIADDPLISQTDSGSFSSDQIIIFVLLFYALATDVTPLRNLVPTCHYTYKNEQTIETSANNNDQSIHQCHLYIGNPKLHSTCITLIHTCLHYASFNVFSLKHLCRYHLRHYFKSRIAEQVEKCFGLKRKHRDYLNLNELLLIYSNARDLPHVVLLIKRLYNMHQIEEYRLFDQEINSSSEQSSHFSLKEVDQSTTDTLSCNDTVQTISNEDTTIENRYQTGTEDIEAIRQRTIEEIMAGSDISSHRSSDDPAESKHSSESSTSASINTSNSILKRDPRSTLYFSDDEVSPEKLENELADMNAKSKDIEEMVEKFLSKK